MANLVFYYGAMGCSKTANALMTQFQYKEKGLKVWLIKPEIDTRDDIVKEDGTTILMSSHYAEDIEALCDTVCEMDQGLLTVIHA